MPKKGGRLFRKAAILLFAAAYIVCYPRPREVWQLGLCRGAEIRFYSISLPGELFGGTVIHNGINYEVTATAAEASAIRRLLDVISQTVVFEGEAAEVIRCLRPQIVGRQEIAGGTLYTCYSPMIEGRTIWNKGRPFNLQIFEKGGKVFVGNPVISGSF